MEKKEKLEAYYLTDHPHREGIQLLRKIALQTDCLEDFKWNFPVYTVKGKNVFGICRFKNYFGIWFFNGSFLKDPKKVLRNAQEGKTKGMRHWNFNTIEEVDPIALKAYINESISNEKNGLRIMADKSTKAAAIPMLLQDKLAQNATLKTAFEALSPYKQKEFCEYLEEAKREATKLRRLKKILPMIAQGVGLNDAYR